MAEIVQPKFSNTNMLSRQLCGLAIAMFIGYVHCDIVRHFLTCVGDMRSLDKVSNEYIVHNHTEVSFR